MSEPEIVGLIGGAFIGFFFIMVGFIIGDTRNDSAMNEMKKKAIELGVAEWKVDKNGGTKFTWKDQL